jgi:hypothetical protein
LDVGQPQLPRGVILEHYRTRHIDVLYNVLLSYSCFLARGALGSPGWLPNTACRSTKPAGSRVRSANAWPARKLLTDPKSQAAGIGPSCAKSWTYDEAIAGIVFAASPDEIAAANERATRESTAAARASVRARIEGDRIVVRSDYDDLIVSIIKTFDDAWWDRGARVWSLPRKHSLPLAEAFAVAGIAHDDLAAIGMGWIVAVETSLPMSRLRIESILKRRSQESSR